MEMKDLLEKMYQFAGEPKQKPGDQVRGKDKAKPAKGKPYPKHPFQGKLVGGDSRNYHDKTMIESNLLAELDQTAKDTKLVRDLAERWKQFKEELMGVGEKRPAREGSRHPRGHEPQQGYKTVKKVDKNKEMKEYGAPANDQQQNMTQQQQDALKKATLATNQMKSATGASASTQNIMKAIDTASQGKSLTGQDAKAIEPMVDVLAQAAADPSLSNQFKSLATQAKQKQQQQQQQQKKTN